ncbi:sensor histidine kinase [Halalkalibacter sp. APA_J-10(15)]|uniref:sensor histidine kinase n=1 Tax=Halalkalibacter sp. APA_J-10(15) TaxID=2933805 RepID=UPI001FF393A7|nr:sensor histidine kinase [Halalkalibacter sp. APA_J-10(15)]MCK0472847.1 sensor histidine kinase [Halalkalibacter sp. APA_J-10(15)]
MNVRAFLKKIHFKKMRTRLLTAFIVLSIAPISVLGIISYELSKNALLNNHIQSNEQHLSTASSTADLLFQNIINLERRILSNEGLRRELIESGLTENQSTTLGTQTYLRLRNILSDILIDQQYIDSVCIMDIHFRTICYGRSPGETFYGQNPLDQSWYQEAIEARGYELFLNHDVLSNRQDVFSSIKFLLDPEDFSLEPLGFLIVNVKKTLFEGAINNQKYGGFLVIDSTGEETRTVYDPSDYLSDIEFDDDLTKTFNHLRNDGYIMTSYQNRTTGWTFAQMIEERKLLRESNQIGLITIAIASSLSLTVFLISLLYSSRFIQPIQQVRQKINEWTKQSSTEIIKKESNDDFEIIGESFDRITTENEQLNEQLIHSQLKERESELRALQTQIKPHFLYNTLDSIYWMAVLENHDKIAKISVALSESFRLVLNNGRDLIPLRQELEHIKHYMTIQNLRFDDRFTYIDDVDHELCELEILKLTLQPLVENAIYHGLEPKQGPGMITVRGKKLPTHIELIVEDNGVGIANLEETEKGYGLNNVRERLQLFYGKNASLTITSEVNQGTKIAINIPNEKE